MIAPSAGSGIYELKTELKRLAADSVRGRSTALNGGDDDVPTFGNNFEEHAPVTDATAETGKALQLADVALKWILLHSRQSSQYARLVARRNRLSDFLAGPARTTVHSIQVLLQTHRIASPVGSHTAAIGARLGGCRHLGGHQSPCEINAYRFPHQLRPRPVLCLPRPFDLFRHRRRQGDGESYTFSHGCYFVIHSKTSQ